MSTILIGKEQLVDAFKSISPDKTIGGTGAFYYDGKKMTMAHFLIQAKMKMFCDVTFLSLYNNCSQVLTEDGAGELVDRFVSSNSNLLVDYVYINKDIFTMQPRYSITTTAELTEIEEWKWYENNTDLISIFNTAVGSSVPSMALKSIIMHPIELQRLKAVADDEIEALSGKSIMWFRGITDWPNDLKWVLRYQIYPTLQDGTLHQEYSKEMDNKLFSKRIYFPAVKFPTGRVVHNTNYLTDKFSQSHIFNDLKTFDYTNSTIEDLRTFVSSRMPIDNYFALFNMEGRVPTTDDLHNRRVFIDVFGYMVPSNFVYEPAGEVMLIGMEDDEIFEIDYENGTSGFKKIAGLNQPDLVASSIYTNECTIMSSVNDINSKIGEALVTQYKTV